MVRRKELLMMYDLMNGFFGDLHWWPAADSFEVMVGAILTQNTAWTNVEKAIKALREKRLLTPAALFSITEDDLAPIIRPSGYYHLKAKRLKAFVRFMMMEYSGNVEVMKVEDLSRLRDKLLDIKGIGPETADSILLYACEKPIFVSDAYTKRILLRHGMIGNDADYRAIQALFMDQLQPDVALFKQYHALIINTGKAFCRKTTECAACPLANFKGIYKRSLKKG